MSHAECRRSLSPHTPFHDNYVCARVGDGTGSCSADGGGPLVTESTPRVLIGVNLWGYCGRPFPGMYSDVSQHLSFTRGAMQQTLK